MSDSEQNDTPLSKIDDNFKNALLTAKKNLYDSIIFAPDVGTHDAQSMELVNQYLKSLNELYKLALSAKKGMVHKDLDLFPYNSRESIGIALNVISMFFKNNSDTVQYDDFISNCYKDYQFILNDNFD